ncbi:hypothetical protein [Leucobacter sp. GX0328]
MLIAQDDTKPDAVSWLQTIIGPVLGITAAGTVISRRRFGKRSWLWILTGVAVLSTWGLLQDLLMIVSGQLPEDLWTLVARAFSAVGAVLLTMFTARRFPARGLSLSAANPYTARIAAVFGTIALLPYAWMKTLWATGGSFAGRSGEDVARISASNGASDVWLRLQHLGLDPTVLFSCAGALLLWMLVLPWSRVIPRWLLLVPSAVGAGTLLPYGLIGIGYTALVSAGVLAIPAGDFPAPQDALLVAWIGVTAFAGFGAALTVAAWAFWSRSTQNPRRRPSPDRTQHDHTQEVST